MRAFAGQLSDNRPIGRTPTESRKLLRDLEETLAALKPHASKEHREGLKRRIGELRSALGMEDGR